MESWRGQQGRTGDERGQHLTQVPHIAREYGADGGLWVQQGNHRDPGSVQTKWLTLRARAAEHAASYGMRRQGNWTASPPPGWTRSYLCRRPGRARM